MLMPEVICMPKYNHFQHDRIAQSKRDRQRALRSSSGWYSKQKDKHTKCTDCKGSGIYEGLNGSEACRTCKGSKVILAS
jgi:DnaJ-class molecular chaperone